jgi:hypothetical protein
MVKVEETPIKTQRVMQPHQTNNDVVYVYGYLPKMAIRFFLLFLGLVHYAVVYHLSWNILYFHSSCLWQA